MNQKKVEDILHDEFIPYAGEIIINNLPSVADGLLSSQRKVLYAMYKGNVISEGPFVKMLRCGAESMKYYVFGDLPLYQLMKQMGNNTLNYLYLDPKGSFGDKQKIDGGASPRYIECKLSTYAEDILAGVNKGIVPMVRNFDNTDDEPIYLPSKVPNVLINTSQSIAVGMASKIPAHNLGEICDAIISYIKDMDIDNAINFIKGADLSLGGKVIYDRKELDKIYKTGSGSFTLIGKYSYDTEENRIIITEVPYETYIEKIEEKIREHYDKGHFKEVIDIHNGSDKDGIKLFVYLKKNSDVNQFVAKLRKFTPFESKMSCNFTLLDLDGKTPLLMSLEDIFSKWISHRKICLKKELEYSIVKLKIQENKLMAIKMINNDLEQFVHIVRKTKKSDGMENQIATIFQLTKDQCEYVIDLKLPSLNDEWIESKLKELDKTQKLIRKDMELLNNDNAITNILIKDIEEMKFKYSKPRLTEVVYEDDLKSVDISLTEQYNCTIIITEQGYIKKNLRYSDNQKMKENDLVKGVFQTNNLSNILVITSKANAYTIKIHTLDEVTPSSLGQYLPSLLSLDEDEKILLSTVTSDYNEGNLLCVYSNGKISKIPLLSYKSSREKLTKSFNANNELIAIFFIKDDIDLMLKTDNEKTLIINTAIIEPKTLRSSQGNQIVKIKKESKLQECKKIDRENIAEDIFNYYFLKNGGVGKKYRNDI